MVRGSTSLVRTQRRQAVARQRRLMAGCRDRGSSRKGDLGVSGDCRDRQLAGVNANGNNRPVAEGRCRVESCVPRSHEPRPAGALALHVPRHRSSTGGSSFTSGQGHPPPSAVDCPGVRRSNTATLAARGDGDPVPEVKEEGRAQPGPEDMEGQGPRRPWHARPSNPGVNEQRTVAKDGNGSVAPVCRGEKLTLLPHSAAVSTTAF
jgi:hypothetical protein